MIHVTVKRRLLPSIRINCPACHAKNANAEVWYRDETVWFTWKITTSWARCTACGTTLYSLEPAETLVGSRPELLEKVLVVRRSLIPRFLAVAACVLCIWPLAGLVVSIAALLANRRRDGWRKASLVAFWISTVISIGITVLILIFGR